MPIPGTGLQTFANSSSTLATLGTTWFSGISNGVLSTTHRARSSPPLPSAPTTSPVSSVPSTAPHSPKAAVSRWQQRAQPSFPTTSPSLASTSSRATPPSPTPPPLASPSRTSPTPLLAVNANGSVVATSTIGNNQLQNSSVTINSTSARSRRFSNDHRSKLNPAHQQQHVLRSQHLQQRSHHQQRPNARYLRSRSATEAATRLHTPKVSS